MKPIEDDDATPPPGKELPASEATEWYRVLRSRFRPHQDVPDNIPTACLLRGRRSPEVLRDPAFSRSDRLIVVFEGDASAFAATPAEITAYLDARQPWEDYDMLVAPENLSWCIGITHDDAVTIVFAPS